MPTSGNRQVAIINKLQEYLKAVGRTPFIDLDFGLCSGLIACQLYCNRLDLSDEFDRDIAYILKWDPAQFKADGLQSDQVIEDFLNTIILLQADRLLRESVKGDQLKQSADLLLGKTASKIAAPEFVITFVFTRAHLLELLQLTAKPGKMIRINNNEHVIGVSCMGGQFILHDFSSDPSDIPCANVAALMQAIFTVLSPWEKSNKHLALHIAVTDLEESVSHDYPNPIELAQKWLRNKRDARVVFHNETIFHQAARYADYGFMDLLFSLGYTYVPWKKTENTELLEAVMNQDSKTLAYLIKHGIPVNAKTVTGMTALGKALTLKKPKMLYKLLEAGADPSIEAAPSISSIEIPLLAQYKDRDNMILLLAFGTMITSSQIQQMYALYGEDADYIVKHALALNAKLLKVPSELDLKRASGRDIVAFLHHAKLLLMLQGRLTDIQVSHNGKRLYGNEALTAVKELYKSKDSDTRWSFMEKAEIYKILKLFDFDEANALIAQLNTIAGEITKIPLQQYRTADIVRIAGILDELTDLSAYYGINLTKLHVSHLAAAAKRSLEAYLRRNGVNNMTTYLREINAPKSTKATTVYFAINHGTAAVMDADYESVIIPELARNLEV